jgi:hypothetical protein
MEPLLPDQEPSEPKKEPLESKKEPEKKDNFESLLGYAQSNPRDVVAYVLMILGIVLLFFQPIYGEFLIGLVFGMYFAKEIIHAINNYESFINENNLGRSIILCGALIALLIIAPAFFIGAAIVIALRLFVVTDK